MEKQNKRCFSLSKVLISLVEKAKPNPLFHMSLKLFVRVQHIISVFTESFHHQTSLFFILYH